MNKTGVPKEAQDDALSNGTTGGHQTSTGRPTRGNVVRMTVFFVFVWLWSELEALNFPFLATLIFWRENIVGDGPLSPRELLRTGDRFELQETTSNKWRA